MHWTEYAILHFACFPGLCSDILLPKLLKGKTRPSFQSQLY